ncbi:MAG: HD domain-containing phosphohydrolase [Chloroflexota bacterium]
MDKPLAVLIAEDAESDAQLIVRMLEKAGYALKYEQVEIPSQMRRALEKQHWDIVISDFSMPEMDGFASLKLLQETGQDIPFIVVSGTMGEETAVAMMKAGAHDYVMKGNLARLVPAVERELIQAEERRERKRAEKQLHLNHTATLNLLQDLKKENEIRRKGEAALSASESELRALFAALTDAVIVYDADGRYLKVAPTNSINLIQKPEELLGKCVHDVLPKKTADFILTKINKAIQTDQIVTGEYALQIDGKEKWFASSSSRLSENTVFWVAHDITERKQAEEQIKNQLETLTALYDLSRKLVGMDDFNDILNLVTQSAVEYIHTTFACFLLLEQDDLELRAAYPIRTLEHEIIMDQRVPRADCPICQRFLNEKVPMLLESADPEADEFVDYFLGFARRLCFIPIRFQDQPFAILLLGEARDKDRSPFSAEKLRLAESIADQAASALHRTLLGEKARHRLQRIASLREIDNAIASSFDLRLSLEVILQHVIEQLKVDAAAVLVVNSSLQRLEYQGGRGFRSQALEHTHQRMDEGQAGLAIRERRMVHIPDVAASGAIFAQSEFIKAERLYVYIAMPLIVKGKAKGVLEIFHRSPLDPDEEWFEFLNTLAGQTAIAIDNDQLFYGLQRSNIELGLAYDATIEGWSHALDLRDKETEGHSLRVARMTVELAQSFNIPDNELKQVRWGALLHDIGKMGVPDSILLKPGPLTDEEWVIMKKHPEFSLEMLSPIQYLKNALDIPYYHHEKWDGSGYPRGLKGEQIPLAARLFAVVDVYDALTSDRPYRKAWTKEKALKHIREQSGKHFDPKVVDAFFRLQNL